MPSPPPPPPPCNPRGFAEAAVAAHNEMRHAHGSAGLRLCESLCDEADMLSAAAVAAHCASDAPPPPPPQAVSKFSIWVDSLPEYTTEQGGVAPEAIAVRATNSWYAGIDAYIAHGGGLTGMANGGADFTRLVWKSTSAMGISLRRAPVSHPGSELPGQGHAVTHMAVAVAVYSDGCNAPREGLIRANVTPGPDTTTTTPHPPPPLPRGMGTASPLPHPVGGSLQGPAIPHHFVRGDAYWSPTVSPLRERVPGRGSPAAGNPSPPGVCRACGGRPEGVGGAASPSAAEAEGRVEQLEVQLRFARAKGEAAQAALDKAVESEKRASRRVVDLLAENGQLSGELDRLRSRISGGAYSQLPLCEPPPSRGGTAGTPSGMPAPLQQQQQQQQHQRHPPSISSASDAVSVEQIPLLLGERGGLFAATPSPRRRSRSRERGGGGGGVSHSPPAREGGGGGGGGGVSPRSPHPTTPYPPCTVSRAREEHELRYALQLLEELAVPSPSAAAAGGDDRRSRRRHRKSRSRSGDAGAARGWGECSP